MKRIASLLVVAGLALGYLGCSAANDAGSDAAPINTTSAAPADAAAADVSLVSLKVPNMF